jgi:hypothetical protein
MSNKFTITFEYPVTRYYRGTVVVEAESEDEAREIFWDSESLIDYDETYAIGDSEPGETEIVAVTKKA